MLGCLNADWKWLLPVAALLGGLTGCAGGPEVRGNGQPVEITRSLEAFTELEINLSQVEVILEQGESYQATLSGEQALLEVISFKSAGEQMKLFTGNKLEPQIPVTVRLQIPDLEKLTITGDSKVSAAGSLKSDKLLVTVSGDSRADLHLQVGELVIRGSGTSYSLWQGSAESADLYLTGAASASAHEMTLDQATVNLNGVSQAQLHVLKAVDANTSGSSQLHISGPAKIGHYSSSGQSSLSLQR